MLRQLGTTRDGVEPPQVVHFLSTRVSGSPVIAGRRLAVFVDSNDLSRSESVQCQQSGRHEERQISEAVRGRAQYQDGDPAHREILLEGDLLIHVIRTSKPAASAAVSSAPFFRPDSLA